MDQRYEMGTKQNPLDAEAVKRKLYDNLIGLYTPEQIEHIIGSVNDIDIADSADAIISSLHAWQTGTKEDCLKMKAVKKQAM